MAGQSRPGDATLRIALLGCFEVRVGERVVVDQSWSRRKAKALVKLLALQRGRSLHREQVVDALWPDLEPEGAANNLHKTLHHLRTVFAERDAPPAAIAIAGDLVTLARDAWVDIDEFRQRARVARGTPANPALYEQALALYGGDLLPEDLYEDWAAFEREELRALHQQLHRALALTLAGEPECQREVDTEVVGYHFAQSDEPWRAAPYLQAAARSAAAVFANDQATALYEQALALHRAYPTQSDAQQMAGLLEELGDVWPRRAGSGRRPLLRSRLLWSCSSSSGSPMTWRRRSTRLRMSRTGRARPFLPSRQPSCESARAVSTPRFVAGPARRRRSSWKGRERAALRRGRGDLWRRQHLAARAEQAHTRHPALLHLGTERRRIEGQSQPEHVRQVRAGNPQAG